MPHRVQLAGILLFTVSITTLGFYTDSRAQVPKNETVVASRFASGLAEPNQIVVGLDGTIFVCCQYSDRGRQIVKI
jgi:hypothetical protein